MKPKTMIALIAALAACAVFIVIRSGYRGATQRRGETAPAGGERIFQPAPIGAKELSIIAADGKTIAFAKADGKWVMTEPIRARADEYKVNQLADVMLSNTAEGIEDGADDEVTGLGKPAWTVKLIDSADRSYSLAVGKAVPMSGGAKTYVRAGEGGGVFAADFNFAEKLSRPVSDYRDKSVWDIRPAQVARVTIAGRESYELIRSDDGWQVVAPQVSAAADEDQVRVLLDKLAYLTVSEFVSDSPAGLAVYGLQNPRLIVTIQLRGNPTASSAATTAATQATQPGETFTLALGGKAGEKVYARLLEGRSVFQLPASAFDDLQPPLSEIRDRRLLRPLDQEVAAVEVSNPQGKAFLTKQDGQWRMEQPHAGPANQEAVSELIDQVANLAAVGFHDDVPSLAAYGLDQPRCTVKLHLAEGGREAWLAVGSQSPSGEMTFARSSDNRAVATVRTADVQPLMEPPSAYWDTSLLQVPADQQPKLLEVVRPGGRYVLTVGGDGRWAMTQPVAAPADGNAVAELLAAVRNVSAQRIVALAPTVPDRFAKAKDTVTVTLTTAAPAEQPASQAASAPVAEEAPKEHARTYTLHAVKLDGGVYAWAEGGQITPVGKMDEAFYDKLTGELRARDVGLPPGADVLRISIARDGGELVLERLAGQWQCSLDPAVRISTTKVDAFLQNAALLKAQSFASYAAPKARQFGLDKPQLAVELTAAEGPAYRLTVSPEGPAAGEYYAAASSVDGVFVLSNNSVRGLSKSLEDFKE